MINDGGNNILEQEGVVMKDNFKTGDLVWIKEKRCWIYCVDDLPEDKSTVKQPDELITNGLPVVFIKYFPKSDWRKWMWTEDGIDEIRWCLVFYKGREWVIDPDYITKTRPD